MLGEMDDIEEMDDIGIESEAFEENDDSVFVFAFQGNEVWRTLVDRDGEQVLPREFASHVTPAPDGVGLMVVIMKFMGSSIQASLSARRRHTSYKMSFFGSPKHLQTLIAISGHGTHN